MVEVAFRSCSPLCGVGVEGGKRTEKPDGSLKNSEFLLESRAVNVFFSARIPRPFLGLNKLIQKYCKLPSFRWIFPLLPVTSLTQKKNSVFLICFLAFFAKRHDFEQGRKEKKKNKPKIYESICSELFWNNHPQS